MISKIRITIISVFLISNVSFIHSQSNYYITGKVINSTNQQPVPFATILLKYNKLGIYANADGDFKVAGNQEFMNDSLIVTCIGYHKVTMAIKDLKTSELNKVRLVPYVYELKTVKVASSGRRFGSYSIIERAIKNIKNNYPQTPFSQISYYRDYQKLNGKYLNLNEAMVQTLDNGFRSESIINKYRLLDFRKNADFARMNISPYYKIQETNDLNYDKSIPEARLGDQYGNELFVLMVHDAIRNYNQFSFSFINTFTKDFLANHNFGAPVPVYDNNMMLFKIIFNGKSRIIGNSIFINGAIYIQPKTYAIHKIEYTCLYNTKVRKSEKMFSIDIEYGHDYSIDSLMRLKYISFNNFFRVLDKDDDTYFRVLKTSWNLNHYINQTLIIEFNNDADPVSCSDKSNYSLTLGKQSVKILNISTSGKKVYIRTKGEKFLNKGDSCYLNIRNVTDVNGNVIEKRKSIDLYQYRELFVQENNKPLHLKDSCFMEYLPLEKNCKSVYGVGEKYWMNTPANLKNNE